MSESGRILMETLFNIAYLIIIWGIIWTMFKRRAQVKKEDRGAALAIFWAFFFLAFGDMGHVGFRVIAFTMGGLDAAVNLFGRELVLAPLGSMATAWTFTLFYVCMVFMWKARFNKPFGPAAWGLFALALIRSVIMLLPGNSWDSQDIQEPLYTLRNLPLMLMQAGAIYLILKDAVREHDRPFIWTSIMIIISLVCYVPVVAFIKIYPMVGMLMVPKTIAYLGIAFIALRALFYKQEQT